jgi:hypothetical protein
MWENILQRGRSQTTIRRMRIASRIPKVTNTNTRWFPTTTMVARTRLSMLCYRYIVCLFKSTDKIAILKLMHYGILFPLPAFEIRALC